MSGWAALVAAAWVAAGPDGGASRPLYTEVNAPPALPQAAQGLPDLSKLAEAVIPAVVGVVTTQAPPPGANDEQLRELFEKLNEGPRKGIGSGFLIHRDGWVITNAHVVEGAEAVEVDFGAEAPRVPARVVGADAESDVALLKIDAKRPLPFVPLGDSDQRGRRRMGARDRQPVRARPHRDARHREPHRPGRHRAARAARAPTTSSRPTRRSTRATRAVRS